MGGLASQGSKAVILGHGAYQWRAFESYLAPPALVGSFSENIEPYAALGHGGTP
jgi:hypothetical protein